MTEPMTPPECDLRGLPFMPLDVVRLADSDLFALSTGEEFKAAVALWCKSWLQVPAASLPNDDRILAHLSGAGSRWPKVKAMALRGWIECSDGRLYHPVVAEKARHAWKQREQQRARANRRWGNDGGNAAPDPDAMPDDHPRQSRGDAAACPTACPTAYAPAMQGRGRVKREEERDIPSSLRSDGAVPARADARAELFRDGLAEIRRITGLPDAKARALIGKCLKATGDNASSVSAAIARAADLRPAEPVPWLLNACKDRPFRNGFLAVIADEGWGDEGPEPEEASNPFLALEHRHGPH